MLNERNLTGQIEDLREHLFMDRYQRLLSWAMRLTNHDRAGAEDLVQDAFIQFTRGRTSLDTIANVDGYLRRMLRYLHLARVTRYTEQMHRQALSISDYDSLSLGLRAFDIHQQLQIKEQLINICRYACIRKETSRAGSVLILRFFHEYSPSEIAKLLCRPRHCVDEWQRLARNEMRLYLDNPRQLSFVRSKSLPRVDRPDARLAQIDLSTALRQMIFRSRQGACLTVDELKDIYVSEILEKLTTGTLAHIVSCRRCLDAANLVLGLSPLSERFDIDEHDDIEPPNDGNGSVSDVRRRLTKHLREVVEHKPQQLRIRMNGVLVSSFRVDSGGGEFLLNLIPASQVSFIEVSSEQGVPLLLFEANAQTESWGQIDLSEGRFLEASLCGNTLSVVYHAPELELAGEAAPLRLLVSETKQTSAEDSYSVINEDTFWHRLKSAFRTQLFLQPAWLSPICVTLLLAIVLLVATLLNSHTAPPITPRNLLERALVAEHQRTYVPGHVTRRVITFEERQPTQGTVISRQRIEIWEDASNGARADRIFDDSNRLLIERLQMKNSGSAVFHHRKNESSPLSAEQILQLQPSVRTFETLVGTNSTLALQRQPGTYVISYSGNNITHIGRLLKATFTLSAVDLHPVEQTLLIEHLGQIRELRFVETSFNHVTLEEVDPTIFQPTPEVTALAIPSRVSATRAPVVSDPRHNTIASEELEIEVAYLLNKAKGDRSEQITLLRDNSGSLRIEGVVETRSRKDELLRALAAVSGSPAVIIDVRAASDFSPQPSARQLDWLAVERRESIRGAIAVDRELRDYLSKSANADEREQLDQAVSAFASKTVNRAYRALFHAVELRQLVDRFSKTNMQRISPEARNKWLEMIRVHAEGFNREYAMLRKELQPLFQMHVDSIGDREEIIRDEDLSRAVIRLERLARNNNYAIRSAFMISAQSSSDAIKSRQFWEALLGAQRIAEEIAKYR